MKRVKLSELWDDVDLAIGGEKSASIRYAILEAHKILEHALVSQGYPGKTIQKKLLWAGYSLEDERGINMALEKQREILNSFDYQISDLEAKEIIFLYKKVVHEIVTKEKVSFKKKIIIFFKVFLSPKSIYFWRNLGTLFSVLLILKILNKTSIGQAIVGFINDFTDTILSWVSVVIIFVFVMIFVGISSYKSSRTGIKIRE